MAHIQRTSRLDLGNCYGMLHDDVAYYCDDKIRSSEAEGKIEEEIKKLGIAMRSALKDTTRRYKSAIADFRYTLTRSICANALDMLTA